MSSTIRIRPQTHETLKEIVRLTGESMPDTLDRAIEELRRKVYLEGLSQDYLVLRSDPRASKEFDQEAARWERTSSDGQENA